MLEMRVDRPLATEWKVVVPANIGADIARWAATRLAPDPHADNTTGDGYRTTTLYFDTTDGDVFARRGSYGRSKYRVRAYGESHIVFLERKMRTADRLSKRRTPIDVSTLPQVSTASGPAGWPGAWFHERLALRRLRPACLLRYERVARVGAGAAGPFRLTIDTGLRGAEMDAMDLAVADDALTSVLPDQAVVEMKFVRDVPAIFKELTRTFAVQPMRFSKYRHARARLMEASCANS